MNGQQWDPDMGLNSGGASLAQLLRVPGSSVLTGGRKEALAALMS